MELKIKSKMELDDYIKFNLFCQRKTILIWIAIVCIGIVIVFREYNIYYRILGCIFFSIFYLLLCEFDIKVKSKKGYNSDKLMQEECEFIVNENGIIEKTSKGETRIEFSDILKFEEDIYSIYIFIGKFRAYVIPKRYITAEEQKMIKEIIEIGKNDKKLNS